MRSMKLRITDPRWLTCLRGSVTNTEVMKQSVLRHLVDLVKTSVSITA